MSCDHERLEELVLGELSASAAAQVTAHARACAPCAAEIQWLRQEQVALAAHGRSLPSALPSFEGVLARSRAFEVVSNERPRRSWVAGMATAAALLLAVGSSLRLAPHVSGRRAVAVIPPTSAIASAEAPSWSEEGDDDEAIATEENHYEACLWASPGAPLVDACL